MPLTHGTRVLQKEPRTGTTENGQPIYGAAESVLGKIVKRRSWVIRGESERETYVNVLYLERDFTAAQGDKVDGLEVVEDMGNNKFVMN